MKLIISLILLGWFVRFLSRESEPTTAKSLDLLELKRQVVKLHEDVNRLEELENILTDIECCSGEHIKAITLDVPTATGHNSLSLFLDGTSSSTEHIRQVVTDEIDSLRCSISEEIISLYGLNVRNGKLTQSTDIQSHDSGRGEGADV